LIAFYEILTIRHGVPFVAILHDGEAIVDPGGQQFFSKGAAISHSDMAAANSVSCRARHIGPAGEEGRIMQ
jgi:hypothetical protein